MPLALPPRHQGESSAAAGGSSSDVATESSGDVQFVDTRLGPSNRARHCRRCRHCQQDPQPTFHRIHPDGGRDCAELHGERIGESGISSKANWRWGRDLAWSPKGRNGLCSNDLAHPRRRRYQAVYCRVSSGAERHRGPHAGEQGMLRSLVASTAVVFAALECAVSGEPDTEFAPPVRLEAGGIPIDTDVGHAAPFVGDFDGDGVRDLLVGQFGEGLLWIYRNRGSNTKPLLAAGVKFKDGSDDGRVPTG